MYGVVELNSDALGSTRLVLKNGNSGGASLVFKAKTYKPFGIAYAVTGSDKVTYASEIKDASGLFYLSARYYDPELGRFVSMDPELGSLSNPQTLNRFVYCANNPLLFIDPTGNDFFGDAWNWLCDNWEIVVVVAVLVTVDVVTLGGATPLEASFGTILLENIAVGAATNELVYVAGTSAQGKPLTWQGAAGAAATGGFMGAVGAVTAGIGSGSVGISRLVGTNMAKNVFVRAGVAASIGFASSSLSYATNAVINNEPITVGGLLYSGGLGAAGSTGAFYFGKINLGRPSIMNSAELGAGGFVIKTLPSLSLNLGLGLAKFWDR